MHTLDLTYPTSTLKLQTMLLTHVSVCGQSQRQHSQGHSPVLETASRYDGFPVHLFFLARAAMRIHDLLQLLHVGLPEAPDRRR
jgi:hypothetical protein